MGLLSWLGGDRRRAAPQDGATTAGDGAESSAPGTAARPPAGAWRELPPVQRTTGDLDLLTDPGGFRASLDSWKDVSLSGPVGHLVDPGAPAGLLYGVAAPVEPPTAATRGAARPSVPEPPSLPGPAVPPGAGTTRPAVALQRVPDGGPLTTAAGPGSGPARHLIGEPVAPDATAAPAVRALPSPAVLPLPPAPVQRALDLPRSPSAQHLGVGEPLAGLPPTAQRSPAARSAPAPSRPDADEPLGLPLPAADGPSQTASEGPASPSGPLLADDPLVPILDTAVQRQPTPPPEHGGPRTSPPDAPTGSGPLVVVGLQRLPATGPQAPSAGAGSPAGPERVAGLTGERPLPLYSGADPTPPRDPGPPVVLARWPVAAGSGAAGGAAPSEAGTARTPPSVQAVRFGADAAPAPPGPGPGPRPGPFGAPDVGKPSSARAGRTGPWADAGSAAIASGVAQRAADGAVVFGAPYSMSPAGPPPAVQRAAESVPEAAPEPVPVPPTEQAAEPGPAAPATSSGGSGSGGPHPGGPGGAQEHGGARQVDDELVRALFPRLSRLIKAELRLDRERAGFLIDTRH